MLCYIRISNINFKRGSYKAKVQAYDLIGTNFDGRNIDEFEFNTFLTILLFKLKLSSNNCFYPRMIEFIKFLHALKVFLTPNSSKFYPCMCIYVHVNCFITISRSRNNLSPLLWSFCKWLKRKEHQWRIKGNTMVHTFTQIARVLSYTYLPVTSAFQFAFLSKSCFRSM